MGQHENITVVSVHGGGGILNVLPAMQRTLDALPGAKALLISDVMVDTEYPLRLCGKLNYDMYSHFMVYCLHNYIDTDYALVIQDDGWVLDAKNWKDEFLDYDYVGGLTHAALVDDQYYQWYQWIDKKEPLVVQNGGFSLRSKRFLKAPSEFGITMVPQDDKMLNNEDIQLCCFMRPQLEQWGLRFAPNDLSKYFSFEHVSPDVHSGMDITNVFGHHSRFRKLIQHNLIDWRLTQQQEESIFGESLIKHMFEHYYGYQLCHT